MWLAHKLWEAAVTYVLLCLWFPSLFCQSIILNSVPIHMRWINWRQKLSVHSYRQSVAEESEGFHLSNSIGFQVFALATTLSRPAPLSLLPLLPTDLALWTQQHDSHELTSPPRCSTSALSQPGINGAPATIIALFLTGKAIISFAHLALRLLQCHGCQRSLLRSSG